MVPPQTLCLTVRPCNRDFSAEPSHLELAASTMRAFGGPRGALLLRSRTQPLGAGRRRGVTVTWLATSLRLACARGDCTWLVRTL